MNYGDKFDKRKNLVTLEQIMSHLDEVTRFWDQLHLSGIGQLDQSEWDTRIKACKDAIEYNKKSAQRLIEILA
jgi:hypothetical protein